MSSASLMSCNLYVGVFVCEGYGHTDLICLLRSSSDGDAIVPACDFGLVVATMLGSVRPFGGLRDALHRSSGVESCPEGTLLRSR